MHGRTPAAPRTDHPDDAAALAAALGRRVAPPQLLHVRHLPERHAVEVPWPEGTPPALTEAFGARGVQRPWRHQVEAAAHAGAGAHVVLSLIHI